MQKTHIIVFGIAVPVVLAVALGFARMENSHASPSHGVETPAQSPALVISEPVPVPTAPTAADTLKTQLRLAADPGTFMAQIQQTPGVTEAEFDKKSSTLTIARLPDGPSPKALAAMLGQAGVVVLGEVMDLPLAIANPHLETCGSCGFELYEQLRKKPGVRAVEVFLPVKNQLRLLVEPGSNTPAGIAGFITDSRHGASPTP